MKVRESRQPGLTREIIIKVNNNNIIRYNRIKSFNSNVKIKTGHFKAVPSQALTHSQQLLISFIHVHTQSAPD